MVWPGAPYPHGAKLYFTCYGGDNNDLKTDGNDPLYCYTNKDGGGESFTQQLYFDSLMNKFVLNHVQIHEIKSPIFYPTSVHQS